MTSTPSDRYAATRGGYRFPPRAELPPGVVVQRIPLLGTSWYTRGILYWTRRIGIGAMMVLVLFAYLAMIEAVLQGVSRPGTRVYWALVAGEIVFTLISGVLMFRHLWHLGISGRNARSRSPRYGRVAGGIGALAASVGGVLAGLIVLCSVITSGVVLAAFAIWLVPVPPTEQYARRLLAEELRVRRDHQQFLHRYSGRRRRKR